MSKDEKKQHFDDIYVAEDPVPYKERILDALSYVSDNFNRQTFDRLVLPWAQQKADRGPLNFVDLAGCFGNTTMATLNGMAFEAIRHNWRDHEAAQKVDQPRRFAAHVTGIDISANALEYGESTGIYDATIEADLNNPEPTTRQAVAKALTEADIVISTAALVYLEPTAVEKLLDAFAAGSGEGYMLVNFLNPFALAEADATKRMLLDKLAFVGSMAARHRRMSELEQANHPGEEWVLLEIWVLKREG
ncbi:hypothetical protein [Thiohalorhabdus sp.]|uniref:hypothetical protein n=1 Tax=Thiohalorhabdus sp. TaxID=3094134 RepID=UPI002FC2B4D6